MEKSMIQLKKWAAMVCMGVGVTLQGGSAFIPQPYKVGDSLVPQDENYYKYTNKTTNTQTIFTKAHTKEAQHAAALDALIVPDYAKMFGWEFDETLYVGLISNHNQIANGFSTQWPNNRQINYVAGSQMVDYFSSTSWLDTLLYHETAHNYQINIKDNPLSQTLHTIFGNGINFFYVPFVIPNVAVNPFMLEGNAVLNESWHGNGGRLYSGRFVAETILQAQAGAVTPQNVYNRRLAFPYGDISYIQGGFYNYYLAQKYGLHNTQSFFRYHSHYWFWPFFTNASMEEAVGVDFEHSLEAFAKSYKKMGKDFRTLHAKEIATSQFFSPLSKVNGGVACLINSDGVSEPQLLRVGYENYDVQKISGSWLRGKVFEIDNHYYTQSAHHTSPTMIEQGLFDNEARLYGLSGSKVMQIFLDNKALYFDTNSSFLEPQLYLGDAFYAQVNSSVISDTQGNIYYFKQKGKTRTLYKNKTKLFSYQGFYGIVSDVDTQGRVYFVANSKLGSSLYRYDGTKIEEVLEADDVVEARLLDDEHVFVATIGSDAYHYQIAPLACRDAAPYETKLFFEEKDYYKKYAQREDTQALRVDTNESYTPLFDMHYHGTEFGIGFVNEVTTALLNVKFADPLAQNSAQIFFQRDEYGINLGGIGYANSESLVSYEVQLYKTLNDNTLYAVNDSGIAARASLPYYQAGYYYGDVSLSYYEDYIAQTRRPLTLDVRFGAQKHFGISRFANYQHNLNLYGVQERDYKIYGGKYTFSHHLGKEFYGGVKAKYSYSSASRYGDAKGVKISSGYSFSDMYDSSVLQMPTLNGIAYLKKGYYAEANLYKTLNFSKYYFTFPLSLQREALYTKYRHYGLTGFSGRLYKANEFTLGTIFDTVVLNDVVLPLYFEYIHTDAAFVQDKDRFSFYLGMGF